MASRAFRRLAHTFKGAPNVNYFPHLSKRRGGPRVSQDRGQAFFEQGRDVAAADFRSSLSDPQYSYTPAPAPAPPPVGGSTGAAKVVPAEGASPFATPEYEPLRHSLKEPDYMSPSGGRQ